MGMIQQHVPGAVPYVLKNTVAAERREKVIDEGMWMLPARLAAVPL